MADKKCKRCGGSLVRGFCVDETCPFSDHKQKCAHGWAGHPDKDPHPRDDDVQHRCKCRRKS